MTRLELLKDIRGRLSCIMDAYEADAEARSLLASLFGCGLTELFTEGRRQVSAADAERASEWTSLRESGEPLAYITGERWFMGLRFRVDPRVLIPRHDTEILCEIAIELIRRHGYTSALDLCTGSGCVAAGVGAYARLERLVAADISAGALEVARLNLAANGIAAETRLSDMFGAIDETFDIVISNPPYIAAAEYAALDPQVLAEPVSALMAGEDGLDFYRVIAREAPGHIAAGGALALEIGCAQARAVSALLEEAGFAEIKVTKDLAGLDRVVSAIRP